MRGAAALGRWIESNKSRISESYRLARPCPPANPYIYSTYKLTSVLLLYCAQVLVKKNRPSKLPDLARYLVH